MDGNWKLRYEDPDIQNQTMYSHCLKLPRAEDIACDNCCDFYCLKSIYLLNIFIFSLGAISGHKKTHPISFLCLCLWQRTVNIFWFFFAFFFIYQIWIEISLFNSVISLLPWSAPKKLLRCRKIKCWLLFRCGWGPMPIFLVFFKNEWLFLHWNPCSPSLWNKAGPKVGNMTGPEEKQALLWTTLPQFKQENRWQSPCKKPI